MSGAVERITDRFLIRQAVRRVCASRSFRTRTAALLDFTPEVITAFAEGFYFPMYRGRVAFGGLIKKLTSLVEAFKKIPHLWDTLKKALGIESVTDIPRAIKEWARKGYEALKKIIRHMFTKFPLSLYTLEKDKLKGVSDIIESLMDRFPQFQAWMREHVKPHVDQFDHWLRENAPVVSGVLTAAVYIWIWMNVTEFEWDWHSLVQGFTGAMGIGELLASLPSSVIGFLLNSFGLGRFTLLPALVVARIVYLIVHRYVAWTGHGFHFDHARLAHDLHVELSEIAQMVPVTV